VRLDFRLVSTKTGEIVLSESGEAKNTITSARSQLQYWNSCLREGFSFTTTEGTSSLIGRTSVDAVKRLAQKLNELSGEVEAYTATDNAESAAASLAGLQGKILAVVSPSDFVVSLGSKDGVQRGDRLIVSIETPLKNQKGEVIYREQKDIATVEVVGMEASGVKARVRLIGQTVAAIQEGHFVRIDAGSAARAPRPNASERPSPAVRDSPVRSPAEAAAPFIRKGDDYFEGGHYAQALEQFQKAFELLPTDFDVLEKMSTVHLYLGNWLETEEFSERILNSNYDVTVPAAHKHGFSSNCEGTMRLSKAKLRFEGKSNDHRFSAARADLLRIGANDAGWLKLSVRMPDGKTKEFELLPMIFTYRKRDELLAMDHVVRPDKEREHRRLLNLLTRLIQKYL
jgi:tetratricopeptide (TPR) repeat protein